MSTIRRGFFKEIFQDESGNYSSKRTIAFMAFFALILAGFAPSLNISLTEGFVINLMIIIVGGMGLTIGENIIDALKNKRDR